MFNTSGLHLRLASSLRNSASLLLSTITGDIFTMRFYLVRLLLLLVMTGWSSTIVADISDSNLSISHSAAGDFLNDPHGHAYIEMTLKNVEASGVQIWYGNWTQANANDPLFAKRVEIFISA
jgi:hypothetical protein